MYYSTTLLHPLKMATISNKNPMMISDVQALQCCCEPRSVLNASFIIQSDPTGLPGLLRGGRAAAAAGLPPPVRGGPVRPVLHLARPEREQPVAGGPAGETPAHGTLQPAPSHPWG